MDRLKAARDAGGAHREMSGLRGALIAATYQDIR
jgi:hypothetical protein